MLLLTKGKLFGTCLIATLEFVSLCSPSLTLPNAPTVDRHPITPHSKSAPYEELNPSNPPDWLALTNDPSQGVPANSLDLLLCEFDRELVVGCRQLEHLTHRQEPDTQTHNKVSQPAHYTNAALGLNPFPTPEGRSTYLCCFPACGVALRSARGRLGAVAASASAGREHGGARGKRRIGQ